LEEKFRLEKEAREDLAEAFIWYESQKEKLGDELVDNVYEKINFITKHPYIYSIYHDEYRKAPVKKFPYYIFYKIKSVIISIVGIWHTSRDTEQINERLEKFRE
jgi:plasmid stabilization system protein ParE